MVIYITVLITAYNRKDYLRKSIDSVINQKLDKDLYEIIVIKNFFDTKLDDYMEEHNIKNIVMEGTEGEYFIKGVKESKGEILAFLDDDDEFIDNKLLYIYEKFTKNPDIIYMHNSYIQIDDDGRYINENSAKLSEDMYIIKRNNKTVLTALKKGGDFNLSCISVRKKILKKYFNYLENIHHMTDTPLFYLCLSEPGNMLLNDYPYTKIRYHVSTSRPPISNNEELIRTLKNNDVTKSISLMAKYFSNYPFYPFVKCMVYSNSIMIQLMDNKYNNFFKNSINFLFCSLKLNTKNRLGFLALYIISYLTKKNTLFLHFYLNNVRKNRENIKKSIKNHE